MLQYFYICLDKRIVLCNQCLLLILGVFYISTYEGVRHLLSKKNVDSRLRALVAGGCASLVGQTIIVPFDVMSQHLMMMGTVSDNKVINN